MKNPIFFLPPICPKVMVIRHAEKHIEVDGQQYNGVDVYGNPNNGSLIPRGWQRAGALVELFDPFRGPLQNVELATPGFIYASFPTPDNLEPLREWETILPLSERLGLQPDLNFTIEEYESMLESALQQTNPVLICWEHDHIPDIADCILGNPTTAPHPWPDNRFDLVWVFDLQPDGKYSFTQVPQNLLAGDMNYPVSKLVSNPDSIPEA